MSVSASPELIALARSHLQPPGATYYEVLGVEEDVQPNDLKKRYYQLAVALHPDKQQQQQQQQSSVSDSSSSSSSSSSSPSEALSPESRFQNLQVAWSILRSPSDRSLYDSALLSVRQRLAAPNNPQWYPVVLLGEMAQEIVLLPPTVVGGDDGDGDGDKSDVRPTPKPGEEHHHDHLLQRDVLCRWACRCGDSFELLESEIEEGGCTLVCESCGLGIVVRRS